MSDDKPDWRTAVQDAMRQAAETEAQEERFNYRWEHVTAVVTLACKLAELTGADADVVAAAAWLHDVRKETGENHPQAGAAVARELLATTNFPPAKIEAVARAIADHKGLWRDEPLTELASQILWDADKLAKLGATAVFHWVPLSYSENPTLSTTDLIAQNKTHDWQEKTVASMHTAPAQRAARARLVRYRQLWTDLEIELSGEDLV